jgi:hypothetical protein
MLFEFKRSQHIFAYTVATLLLLTAGAKAIALFEHKGFLNVPDGVFSSLTTRKTLLIAMITEVIVALFIFFRRKELSSMVACSWLATLFMAYHMLAYSFFAQRPCRCLGGVLDWTGLPPRILDEIPIVLICYMEVGSLMFLLCSMFQHKLRN